MRLARREWFLVRMRVQRLRDAVSRIETLTGTRPTAGRTHDAADDTVGTIATDSARGFDPFPLLATLQASGVHVIVIGQVAGIMHGSTELTGDLDLLWDADPSSAAALAAAFAAAGCSLWADDASDASTDPELLLRPKATFESARACGDCCTPSLPWGGVDLRAVLARSETATAPDGLEIRIPTLPDLIHMQRALGRPKDLRRAAELERLGDTS
ncbi:hypothetical protein [Streptomyces sp. NPDC055794]